MIIRSCSVLFGFNIPTEFPQKLPWCNDMQFAGNAEFTADKMLPVPRHEVIDAGCYCSCENGGIVRMDE